MKRLGAIPSVLTVLFCGSFAAAVCGKDPSTLRLRQFVNQTFIHGVSFAEGSKFSSDRDVQTLECLLNDPEEQPYWRNIATVLGMSGNPRATEPLIKFLESGEGTLSRDSFAARSSAVLALGYLAPKDPTAMAYLRKSTDPDVWDDRGVKWTGPYFASEEERDADLSKHAILALGLSGNPTAAEYLVSLKRGHPIRLSSEFDDVIAEAIKTNEKVQQNGTAAYGERR